MVGFRRVIAAIVVAGLAVAVTTPVAFAQGPSEATEGAAGNVDGRPAATNEYGSYGASEGLSGDDVIRPQVVNGRDFPLTNPYPWVAGVFQAQPGDWNELLCSGTLIAPDWVLTSASCMTSPDRAVDMSRVSVAVGVREFVNIPESAFTSVAQIYVHPEWKRSTKTADVALLRLVRPTTATPIETISAEVQLTAGTGARVAGWGLPKTSRSYALQWGDVEVLSGPSDPFCRDLNYLPANGPVYQPGWMVCAMGTDMIAPVDACEGDAGGPLMVSVDNTWRLAGIAAWVDTCEDYYNPAVFTRVNTAKPWLQKQMETPDITACGVDEPMPFVDVGLRSHYRNAVECLASRGIISTDVARTYNPAGGVTRAQMAAFLWRMNGAPSATNHTFRDEAQLPSWSRVAADWLKETGLTVNDPYRPGVVVTRGQMAAFLWRFAGEPEAPQECGFVDVKDDAYYGAAACWLKATGLTTGVNGDASQFDPGAALTRGQMASFLYRFGLHQGYWFNLAN